MIGASVWPIPVAIAGEIAAPVICRLRVLAFSSQQQCEVGTSVPRSYQTGAAAHWIDPASVELLGPIVDRIPTLRVLLIATFRPEFEPPWIGRPYVTALTINRLGERDISALIDRLIGNKPKRARSWSSTAGKILGTPRRNEHGAALARPGQAG